MYFEIDAGFFDNIHFLETSWRLLHFLNCPLTSRFSMILYNFQQTLWNFQKPLSFFALLIEAFEINILKNMKLVEFSKLNEK